MNKKYNEEYYGKAYDYIKNGVDYNIRAAIAFKKYFSDIKDIQSKKTLEIGAGLGKNIYFVKNAVAYDPSPFSREYCIKKGIMTVDYIAPNKYDIIAAIHTLEHVEKPLEQLKDIFKKLKNGGVFVLILPCERHSLVK